jgi:hypothetical protein
MAPHYTCERHKATGECLACKNEQAYATEEVFRQFSPLPEYDGLRPGDYGQPPNAYSRCPVCGGDTGSCKCVQAGIPPDRLGTSPDSPTPRAQTPGNTDYGGGQNLGWNQYLEDRKAAKERRRDPVVGNLSDRAANPIAQHEYSGGLLSFFGLGGPCNICGMGKIANCHL